MSWKHQFIFQTEIDDLEQEAIDFYENYGPDKWRDAFATLAAEFRELKSSYEKVLSPHLLG